MTTSVGDTRHASLEIGRNASLFESHIAAGYRWVQNPHAAFFEDENGDYAAHPVGFIRGPQLSECGSPTPLYISIYLPNGCWLQRNGTIFQREELINWAIDQQNRILDQTTE